MSSKRILATGAAFFCVAIGFGSCAALIDHGFCVHHCGAELSIKSK